MQSPCCSPTVSHIPVPVPVPVPVTASATAGPSLGLRLRHSSLLQHLPSFVFRGTCADGVTGAGTCLCDSGFTGTNCDIECFAGGICSRHGSCAPDGSCFCHRCGRHRPPHTPSLPSLPRASPPTHTPSLPSKLLVDSAFMAPPHPPSPTITNQEGDTCICERTSGLMAESVYGGDIQSISTDH